MLNRTELLNLFEKAAVVAVKSSGVVPTTRISFDGNVSVEATDLDIHIEAVSDHLQPGIDFSCCLDAERVLGVLKAMDAEFVEVAHKDDRFIISDENAEYEFTTVPAEDFPEFQREEDNRFVLKKSCGALLPVLHRLARFVSSDESRYCLNGVCFDFKEERTKLVATDGHRLAVVELDWDLMEGTPPESAEAILPTKAVKAFIKFAPEFETVHFGFSETLVTMDFESSTSGKLRLTARLVGGAYPDWRAVIPKEDAPSPVELNLEVSSLVKALRRIKKILPPKQPGVIFRFGSGCLEIVAEDPLVKGKEIVPASVRIPEGAATEVGFNANYILDVCSCLISKEATFEIRGSDLPAVVEDYEYLYLLMPMTTY